MNMSEVRADLATKAAVLDQMRATTEAIRQGANTSTFQLLQDHSVNIRSLREAFTSTRRPLEAEPEPDSMGYFVQKWDIEGTLMLATCIAQGRSPTADEAKILTDQYETIISGSQHFVDMLVMFNESQT
jgi:hypothetical protein